MTWFRTLTGFDEQSAEDVRQRLSIDGQTLVVNKTGSRYRFGRLETPTLAELRNLGAESTLSRPSTLREVVGDVQALHRAPENEHALFQVASQFNLLEMVSPARTPEHGVACYEHDRTQGPACAIAAGAGTIYRNYFVEVGIENHGVQVGQTEQNQLDMLRDLGRLLENGENGGNGGNSDIHVWRMQNGYALPTPSGLAEIGQTILGAGDEAYDRLRQALRVGVQWNTEVTLGRQNGTPSAKEFVVTQVYASALPIAYSRLPLQQWRPFASLILEASYEATLWAAVTNARRTGNRSVFLTLLGGGAFGNPKSWIFEALESVLPRFAHHDLDIAIVSYGRSVPNVAQLVDRTGLQAPERHMG